MLTAPLNLHHHDDDIKWKHFPCYRPFVRGIHRSAINSPHIGQWRGALMFPLICAWINAWASNRIVRLVIWECHRAHYDVIVMTHKSSTWHGVFWINVSHFASDWQHEMWNRAMQLTTPVTDARPLSEKLKTDLRIVVDTLNITAFRCRGSIHIVV